MTFKEIQIAFMILVLRYIQTGRLNNIERIEVDDLIEDLEKMLNDKNADKKIEECRKHIEATVEINRILKEKGIVR